MKLKRAKRPAATPPGKARGAAPGEPVNGPGLEALASPGAAAGRALAATRALAASERDPAALALLRALERGAEAGQLALPPLPEVVLRVRDLVERPDLRIPDLERELQRDPVLATRIVGVANSPFYGAVRPASSIGEAIVRVGLRQTRHLVLALALRSRVLRAPGRDAEVAALWDHALAASVAGQALAALLGEDPDEAALLGLVHDVGRVAILATQGELERASRGQVQLAPESLDRIAAALHPLAGALLADAWSLAPAVVAAISHHHDPTAAPGRARALAGIAASADALARILVGAEPEAQPPSLGGIDPDIAAAALEEAREAHTELIKVL